MIGRVRRMLVAEPVMTARAPRARLRGRGARAASSCPTRPTPGRRAPTSISASRCSRVWRSSNAPVADLLRAYPFDFLYGNIAADSSIAKHYAPLGRHCHYWHVGQEIHDLAESDALRAFGLGYLCHLAADTVAHNYFVPRQLMITSSTAAVGHSYWETRVETHLGDAYAEVGQGRDPAGPRRGRRAPRPDHLARRSSACAPIAGCSAAWST